MDSKIANIVRHLIFWVLFILLWSAHDLNYHKDFLANLQTNFFAFIPYAVLVYFNLYYLMPRMLLKRKILEYLALLIFSIGIITWLASEYLHFYFSRINIYEPTALFFKSFEGKIAIITEIILALGLSMTLFLLDEWYRKDRSMRDIEKKRLETELSLLKSQINPHFLFNSLNSIYVMLGRNLEDGKKMLLQFSEILSHQLYETSKEKIALQSEFDNLSNFINIERARHQDIVTVRLDLTISQNHLFIAPMLLLPIVENTFKHGQSSAGYEIRIEAQIVADHVLHFYVENTVSENLNLDIPNKTGEKEKGIGLANVKRRLELIYPYRHEFIVKRAEGKFKVSLKIGLDDDKVFNS